MKDKWLPFAILIMGLVYIYVIPPNPEALKILFKLIPMWLILFYAFRSGQRRSRYHSLIIIGLFFCMMGDGLLRWFVIGLSAFLIGHLFYSAAFLSRWRFSWLRLCTVIPIILYLAVFGNKILSSVSANGDHMLIIPLIAYMIIISLMGWSALMTGNRWAIIGSLLFIISDSLLSWLLFVGEIAHGGQLVMLTYYSAQFLLARSLVSVDEQLANTVHIS